MHRIARDEDDKRRPQGHGQDDRTPGRHLPNPAMAHRYKEEKEGGKEGRVGGSVSRMWVVEGMREEELWLMGVARSRVTVRVHVPWTDSKSGGKRDREGKPVVNLAEMNVG